MRTAGAIRAGAALVVFLSASVAMAGILADGDYGMAGWYGRLPFRSVPFPLLAADLEYCVYAPAEQGQQSNFEQAFPGAVDPSNGTHHVYAYQIFNDLVDHPWSVPQQRSPVSRFTIGLNGQDEAPANLDFIEGTGDVEPDMATSRFEPLTGPPEIAIWSFMLTNIEYMEVSDVLFFTAPGDPETDTGSMLGDLGAGRDDMPSPSAAPEPVTLTLFALSAAFVCCRRRAGRRGMFFSRSS